MARPIGLRPAAFMRNVRWATKSAGGITVKSYWHSCVEQSCQTGPKSGLTHLRPTSQQQSQYTPNYFNSASMWSCSSSSIPVTVALIWVGGTLVRSWLPSEPNKSSCSLASRAEIRAAIRFQPARRRHSAPEPRPYYLRSMRRLPPGAT